jgi:hypothetical protein
MEQNHATKFQKFQDFFFEIKTVLQNFYEFIFVRLY